LITGFHYLGHIKNIDDDDDEEKVNFSSFMSAFQHQYPRRQRQHFMTLTDSPFKEKLTY